VVTTEDEEVFGVLDLVRKQKTNGLERLFSSVDIVTQEEVVCFWGETAILEQPQEIVVLSVNVTYDVSLLQRMNVGLTANFDRRLEFEEDRLADEDFTSAGTEVLDLVFLQSYRFARSVPSDCSQHYPYPLHSRQLTFEETVNDGVEVDLGGSVGHCECGFLCGGRV